METSNQKTRVTVQAVIQAPVEKVWRYWSEPKHITKWNQASETWHSPRSENEQISYTLGDGRKVDITFINQGNETKVVEIFDAESTHSIEMQQAGWQAIMDNFKRYSEVF